MLVRIAIGYRSSRDLMRQTPGGRGEWDGIRFTLDPISECDYLVVLSYPREPFDVRVPPSNVWLVAQEPPVSYHRPLHRPGKVFSRVFTSDPALGSGRYVQSQPALPWHVDRTLDQLRSADQPEKTQDLSWITSSLAKLPGHRSRMDFLERLQSKVEFDLYGRGFKPIEDKWDALAPYRYSIAVENHSNPWYWTEKLSDCFLSWTVPIYFGCTRIDDYFPAEAMVRFDPSDHEAVEKIEAVIANDDWEGRLDALAEARRRTLDRFQIFPFLAAQIRADCARGGGASPEAVHVSARHTVRDSLAVRMQALRARGDRNR
jgi:Glycosyltransferase family 10 (fucosyltransferase) C-term